ncbi:hypothetical protein B0T17DRAFT_619402 [Bombardia bombarda]|uniref:C2H2-type domain-containing protein n=1 Tax=Bombardia bombarda TaxID=252184 RepID=A0AA39WI17_9PEZI|nr:hypothetical protein B0T17DRAFT_619402 [Bombardia bombarda]
MDAPGFTSRRAAAGALPSFTLPPVPTEIPSTRYPNHASTIMIGRNSSGLGATSPFPQPISAFSSTSRSTSSTNSSSSSIPNLILTPTSGRSSDGLSPSSGVNSQGGSQSSQLGGGGNSSMSFASQIPGGQWSAQGSPQNPGFTYANSTSSATPGPHLHSTSFSSRPSTLYNMVSPPLSQFGSGGGGGGSLGSSQGQGPLLSSQGPGSQPPTPTTSYYGSSSPAPQQTTFSTFPGAPPQQSPTIPSPTTSTGAGSRTLGPISSGGMAPPLGYGGAAAGRTAHPMPSVGPYAPQYTGVLSNMHQPGSALSMVGIPGYGAHHHHNVLSQHASHMYGSNGSGGQSHRERPFKCDQCTQSFNRNHDLKRHKRIHLAVKPYPCTRCDKSFSRKDALKRHKLVKGCGANGATISVASPRSDGSDTSGRSPVSIHKL